MGFAEEKGGRDWNGPRAAHNLTDRSEDGEANGESKEMTVEMDFNSTKGDA